MVVEDDAARAAAAAPVDEAALVVKRNASLCALVNCALVNIARTERDELIALICDDLRRKGVATDGAKTRVTRGPTGGEWLSTLATTAMPPARHQRGENVIDLVPAVLAHRTCEVELGSLNLRALRQRWRRVSARALTRCKHCPTRQPGAKFAPRCHSCAGRRRVNKHKACTVCKAAFVGDGTDIYVVKHTAKMWRYKTCLKCKAENPATADVHRDRNACDVFSLLIGAALIGVGAGEQRQQQGKRLYPFYECAVHSDDTVAGKTQPWWRDALSEASRESVPAEEASRESAPAEEASREAVPAEESSREAAPAEPALAVAVLAEAAPAEEASRESVPAEEASRESAPAEEASREAVPAEESSREAAPAESAPQAPAMQAPVREPGACAAPSVVAHARPKRKAAAGVAAAEAATSDAGDDDGDGAAREAWAARDTCDGESDGEIDAPTPPRKRAVSTAAPRHAADDEVGSSSGGGIGAQPALLNCPTSANCEWLTPGADGGRAAAESPTTTDDATNNSTSMRQHPV